MTKKGVVVEKIKIPFTIKKEERNLIRNAYDDGVRAVNFETASYVRRKLPRLLKRLAKSDEDWLRTVADTARAFFDLIETNNELPAKAKTELLAALHYLCHPFEVIPDHVPGRGYADDALVLNMCLQRLKSQGFEFPARDLSKQEWS